MVKYKQISNTNNGLKRKIMKILFPSLLFLIIGFGFLLPIEVQAAEGCPPDASPTELARCGIEATDPDGQTANSGKTINKALSTVLEVFRYVVGVASVIVILVQAFRLIVSAGDSKSVISARNGIIYAAVGLVLAIVAPEIVLFIVERFQSQPAML